MVLKCSYKKSQASVRVTDYRLIGSETNTKHTPETPPQYMEWEVALLEAHLVCGLVHDVQERDDYALELAMADE